MVRSFFRAFITCCLCAATFSVHAKEKKISLKRALKDKLIELLPISTGGYCGKSLSLTLISKSKEPLTISIEPGLEFRPKDSSINAQPLILLGDEAIVLAPDEQKTTQLQTFCGNSGANAPYVGIPYSYYRQHDTNMVNVLRYARNNHLDPHLVQSAVWSFTNAHVLRSVYSHEFPNESEALVKYIASVRKMKVPSYYLEFKQEYIANRSPIRRGEERIFVNMSWRADQGYRNVYVSVYRPDGSVYKQVGNIVSDKNGSIAVVELNMVRDRRGKYIVRLHDDANNILQEKVVLLGTDEDMY